MQQHKCGKYCHGSDKYIGMEKKSGSTDKVLVENNWNKDYQTSRLHFK